jgi:hypothetical protein
MFTRNLPKDVVDFIDNNPRGITDETGVQENVKVENTVTLNKQNLFVLKSGKGSSAQNLLVSTSIEQVLVAKELNLKDLPQRTKMEQDLR